MRSCDFKDVGDFEDEDVTLKMLVQKVIYGLTTCPLRDEKFRFKTKECNFSVIYAKKKKNYYRHQIVYTGAYDLHCCFDIDSSTYYQGKDSEAEQCNTLHVHNNPRGKINSVLQDSAIYQMKCLGTSPFSK